ncbi:hypothetical protein ACFL5V_02815 [Fibrobacterota bacterium]
MSIHSLSRLILVLLVRAALTQGLDSRNMDIPTNDKEIKKSLEDLKKSDDRKIRLHYKIELSDRMAAMLYSRTLGENLEENFGYVGVEPVSFTKPADGLYKAPLGAWGWRLKKAMRDNPKAYNIMANYQLRSMLASIMLVAGFTTGIATTIGLINNQYFFGEKRNEHLVWGVGTTLGFFTMWTIPKLFNRGKIYKAFKIYNK